MTMGEIKSMHFFKNTQATTCNASNYIELSTELQAVASVYPCRVSAYYAGLINTEGDAIWRQCMPDIRELLDDTQLADPLAEGALSPVPGVIHRYPDRVVLLVSNRCPVYCRFCMRKRHVGSAGEAPLDPRRLEKALDYIRSTPAIHDVILSGGDPLMLDDESLQAILIRLREIRHVKIIRIGTRIPVTLPERVTPELCSILSQYHPLYINTHFNHPAEITPEAELACARLADAGIPLGCQTVLLRGVNDSPEIIRELLYRLVRIRVKPYYLFQADLTKGTSHFRTTVDAGLDIMRQLIGHVSGIAIPTYALDAPGGCGKIPLTPNYIKQLGATLDFSSYQGAPCSYPNRILP